jgi:tripartite-type tricarboxylate transporter receptor subunit TctC
MFIRQKISSSKAILVIFILGMANFPLPLAFDNPFSTVVSAKAAHASDYPNRPVRFIVPFPPGGGADALARIVAQKLSTTWGQQVIVDNRGGAGGNLAAEIAAKAPSDGYTIFQGNVAHTISVSLYAKLNYDLLKDFIPVTQLASIPFMLVVNPGLNLNSVKELISQAKAKPGQFNYASSGSGGPSHLAMELFKSMAGINVTHVPYKGASLTVTDLMSGQVHMMYMTLAAALPHVTSGRLKGLAVASDKRIQAMLDLPTVAEAGVPGFEASTWFGVMVPKGTPKSIVDKLHQAMITTLGFADVKDRLARQAFVLVGSSPDEFGQYIAAEIPKWARIVKLSGAKVE